MYDDLVKAIRQNTCHFDACGMCPKRNALCMDRMALQAADAIEALIKPRWIPTTEQLPELNVACLVYNKYYGPMVGWRVDGKRFRIPGSRFPDHPTHWMPLPAPPKEEVDGKTAL